MVKCKDFIMEVPARESGEEDPQLTEPQNHVRKEKRG
jgi:hypothetical protein